MDPEDVSEVFTYLNRREKGYSLEEVLFHPTDNSITGFTVLVYVATESNEHYLGPAPIEDIAKQVVSSKGYGGHNTQYVLELAKAMRKIAPLVYDQYLFELERKVKELMKEKETSSIELKKD